MSDVKKCDRCGAFYEDMTKSRFIVECCSSLVKRTRNGGDMRPECAEEFDKWWNKIREGE